MSEKKLNLIQKVSAIRSKFLEQKLTKGSKNKFYSYFGLEDFIPKAIKICAEFGALPLISYGESIATMTIYDEDSADKLTITTPMSTCDLKGCHPVQNLGSVETYLRRYLWLSFLEIVEHDGIEELTDPTVDVKEEAEKKAKDEEAKHKKEAIAKLTETLVTIAKEKGYTEKEALNKFPEGIYNYPVAQIEKTIEWFAKKTAKQPKSLMDEEIEKECKERKIDNKALVEIIKKNFAKGYGKLTDIEKTSLLNIIKGIKNEV